MSVDSTAAVPLGGGIEGETILFEIGQEDGVCRLRASYRSQVIDLMGPDFFSALCQVRNILALAGLYPLCYGASLDVYCTELARAGTNGLAAYQLTMGRAPDEADIVEIFDCGPDVCVATVVEQKKYYLQWLDSVRGNVRA